MKLENFRKLNGWSYGELARRTGASDATVARRWCLPSYEKQSTIPAHAFMKRILEISDGAVTPNDFYDFDDGR